MSLPYFYDLNPRFPCEVWGKAPEKKWVIFYKNEKGRIVEIEQTNYKRTAESKVERYNRHITGKPSRSSE